jgi:hypothetical protein
MRRVFGIASAVVAALVSLQMLAGPAAAQITGRQESMLEDALTLFYLKAKIYPSPITCRRGWQGSRLFFFCTPYGGDIGGLYMVEPEGGGFVVFAVNGKAMQHMGRSGGRIETVDGKPIPLRKWPPPPLDVPRALELFK